MCHWIISLKNWWTTIIGDFFKDHTPLKNKVNLYYVGDAHVPLHTTENYNGKMTGQKGIHGFWESRLPEINADNYNFFVLKAFLTLCLILLEKLDKDISSREAKILWENDGLKLDLIPRTIKILPTRVMSLMSINL